MPVAEHLKLVSGQTPMTFVPREDGQLEDPTIPEVAAADGAALLPFPEPSKIRSHWETALALATINLVSAYQRLQCISPDRLPLSGRTPFELVCSGMCETLDAIDLLGAIVWDEGSTPSSAFDASGFGPANITDGSEGV